MQIMKSMAAKARLLAIALALFGLMAGAAQGATKMPAFALPAAKDGAMVKSSDYAGKVVLINFFATWCPPCRQEIPDFIKVQKEYGPKGFSIIGLSVDEGGTSLVDKFAQKMQINYPVLMSNPKTAKDFGGILGIPTSFLVNKDGSVVKRYDGYVDHQTLVNDINSVLK